MIGSKSVSQNQGSQPEETQRQRVLLQIHRAFDNLKDQIKSAPATLSKRFHAWMAERARAPSDSQGQPSVLLRVLPVARKVWAQVRAKFTTGALVFASLVLLGSGVLAVSYFRQQDARDALLAKIESVQRAIRRYGTEESRAQSLAEAESRLLANQGYFPTGRTSASVLAELLTLAQETGVQLSSMDAYISKDSKVDPAKYSVITVNLQAKGSMEQLGAFLEGLESERVKAVSITRVTVGGVSTNPQASLSISAFGRK